MDSINQEIIDLLSLEINENSNSDGMVYSYYVEFPKIESLKDSTLVEVLKILDINIPFNKSYTYLDIFSKKIFKNGFNFQKEEKLNCILNELIEKNENKIIFKSLKSSRETILKLLRFYNFPEGNIIIDQADYQDELNYNLDIEEFYRSEYETYLDLNLNYLEIVDEINNLKQFCEESSNEIIKKSLILAAFSQTESFFKSVIYNNLPNFEKNIENEGIRDIISKKFENDLKRKDDRINIFRKIFVLNKKDFKDIGSEYYDLRNVLAHDIGSVSIEENNIWYKDSNIIDINMIFTELINFINSINNVENFDQINSVNYDKDSPY